MAEQDKTDFYWNGELAGAVNNLYYNFINVDVVPVPYATTHRNSSFFLKTRLGYIPSDTWANLEAKYKGWTITDVQIIYDDNCTRKEGTVYALGIGPFKNKKRVFKARIVDGCVDTFTVCSEELNVWACSDNKLFVTNYVKGDYRDGVSVLDCEEEFDDEDNPKNEYSGIQINEYSGGTTHGLFSDEYVEEGKCKFKNIFPGDYLLVYSSLNEDDSGFAGQVRMVTGIDSKGRITLDASWEGFKTLSADEKEVRGGDLKYAFFKERGEVVGYASNQNVYIITGGEHDACNRFAIYNQVGLKGVSKIIGVTSALEKIFILTENGYIHYNNTGGGYDKFFIQDDMFAGADKTSITTYKDIILAMGNKHIAVGIPDDNNEYWTMYNQSTTVGTWSRYSYAEYDGDLLFVSNDRRLLALSPSENVGKYMLQYKDVGDMLNGKLSVLTPGDEVFIGSDDNNLRIFIYNKYKPFVAGGEDKDLNNLNEDGDNSMTCIHKFDTVFKVWTEDHITGICLCGAIDGVYYGEGGIYSRNYTGSIYDAEQCDIKCGVTPRPKHEYKANISAFLIENETNWLGNTSWLVNRPKLFNLTKLNKLITVLGPGKYSNNSKIRITSYRQGVGVVYEFPIGTADDTVSNTWVDTITRSYISGTLDISDVESVEGDNRACLLDALQDSQSEYQPKCEKAEEKMQNVIQTTPRCGSYKLPLVQDHGICINDTLYRFAPTMPLVTSLGENQQYSTQIKIEIISEKGDVISFGGWVAELFIAPLGITGPDGEYELQSNTDC